MNAFENRSGIKNEQESVFENRSGTKAEREREKPFHSEPWTGIIPMAVPSFHMHVNSLPGTLLVQNRTKTFEYQF